MPSHAPARAQKIMYPLKDNMSPRIKYEIAKTSVYSIARMDCSPRVAVYEYPDGVPFSMKKPGKFGTLRVPERFGDS